MMSQYSILWAERSKLFAEKQCPLGSITSIPLKAWLRASILQLFLAMMIAGLSNSPSSAEDGLVYPDSARVSFTRTVSNDTIIIIVNNLSSDSVRNFFMSDFTDSQAVDIDCLVDDIPCSNLVMEREFGSVYAGKFTTRWIIGSFFQTAYLKYYSRQYSSDKLSWSAGHPYAILGTMLMNIGIGPPRDLHWGQ